MRVAQAAEESQLHDGCSPPVFRLHALNYTAEHQDFFRFRGTGQIGHVLDHAPVERLPLAITPPDRHSAARMLNLDSPKPQFIIAVGIDSRQGLRSLLRAQPVSLFARRRMFEDGVVDSIRPSAEDSEDLRSTEFRSLSPILIS